MLLRSAFINAPLVTIDASAEAHKTSVVSRLHAGVAHCGPLQVKLGPDMRLGNSFTLGHFFTSTSLGCLVGLVSLTGCVDTSIPRALSKQQFCEERTALDCKVYWSCMTMDQREAKRPKLAAMGKDIGVDQAACTKNLQALCLSKPFTCGQGLTFQEMKATLCINSLTALSCERWLREDTDVLGCDQVCSPTVGGI